MTYRFRDNSVSVMVLTGGRAVVNWQAGVTVWQCRLPEVQYSGSALVLLLPLLPLHHTPNARQFGWRLELVTRAVLSCPGREWI